ncbi:hypothetical protein PPROV_000312100 [Pycnococcus provasolii]|uniref:Importin N-terminal domain-containing protein n=1 Tax=Pycnococcus provasolii TaxID=41880 RepID=A0A830HH24_9CHLO|nr:hypothetical protein PPROV_000312100 [Pycnococcus provasolii]
MAEAPQQAQQQTGGAPSQQPSVFEVTAMLQQAQSAEPVTRKAAEDQIRQFQEAQYPSFFISMTAELANETKPLAGRRLASLILKNVLDAKEATRKAAFEQLYLQLPANVTAHVKGQLVTTLASAAHEAALGAAQVIGKMAAVEVPKGTWPDLIDSLLNHMRSPGASAVLRRATLECLGFVCEELEPEHLEPAQVNAVLTAVVGGMAATEVMEVRIAACTALSNALQFASANFEKENERDVIMQTLCEGCVAADARLRQTSLEAIVDVCAEYYKVMPKYIVELFNITGKITRQDQEEVALQAIEVWSTICDEEIALQEEIDEATSDGSSHSVVHHYFIQQALPGLVPLLLETMMKQEEDQVEDDGAWNLSMAAGCCLQLAAATVRDQIVDPVMEFVKMHITGAEWRQREAATFAFGSILEGPRREKLKPLVAMGLDFLLTALKSDTNYNVKDTTAWAISRICELLHGTNYDADAEELLDDAASNPAGAAGSTSTTGAPGSGADSASSGVINAENLPRVVNALLECAVDRPHIAERVCCALAHLASGFGDDCDKPSGALSPYNQMIIAALLQTGARTDAGQQATKLRVSAYEALNEVVRSAANDQLPVITQLVPVVLQKLNEVAQRMQAAESGTPVALEPNVSAQMEAQRNMEVQGLLCGTLQVIMTRLAEKDDTIIYLKQFADHIMASFLQVLQLTSKGLLDGSQPAAVNGDDKSQPTVHEECMLAIGTLASVVGPEFEKYLSHLFVYIDAGLKNIRDKDVCTVTVGVVGDICRAMEDKILPFCDKIMLVLLEDLRSPDLHRSVKPGMLSCFGEIALAVGPNYEKYLPYALPVLTSAAMMCGSPTRHRELAASETEDDEDVAEYANNLRVGVLEAYSGMMQGFKPKPGEPEKPNPFFRPEIVSYLNEYFKFCEDVAMDSEKTHEVAKALAGSLGDSADCLKPHIATAFKQKRFWQGFLQDCITGSLSVDDRVNSTAQWAQSIIVPLVSS